MSRKMLKKVAVSPRRRSAARAKAASQVRLVRDDETPAAEAPVASESSDGSIAVAEMEAVAESDDEAANAGEGESEPEPEPKPAAPARTDEPSNFLALYFREMARLSVLRPEQEFESARQIEQ